MTLGTKLCELFDRHCSKCSAIEQVCVVCILVSLTCAKTFLLVDRLSQACKQKFLLGVGVTRSGCLTLNISSPMSYDFYRLSGAVLLTFVNLPTTDRYTTRCSHSLLPWPFAFYPATCHVSDKFITSENVSKPLYFPSHDNFDRRPLLSRNFVLIPTSCLTSPVCLEFQRSFMKDVRFERNGLLS